MLDKLEVVNFLSYEHETLTFSANATIAVVGENGHGKSGLLEAILFALYGEGREDLSKLVRIGCNADMKVVLTLTGVPAKAKTLVVERGVKKNGTGYTQVHLNDVLIASGGAKPANNKAQTYINTILGVDKESFLLTSFFGMGANDSLMQVLPSARLETLQKLAGVDVCMEFNKVASDYAKQLNATITTDNAVISALEGATDNGADLKKELKIKNDELVKLDTSLNVVQAKRRELAKEEVKYQNLLREMDKSRAAREAKMSAKESAEKRHTRAVEALRVLNEESKKQWHHKAELEARLAEFPLEKELLEGIEALNTQITSIGLATDLKVTALSLGTKTGSGAACPLCTADVTVETLRSWEMDVKAQEILVTELRYERSNLETQLTVVQNTAKKLERLQDSMESTVEDKKEREQNCKDTDKELKVLTADLEKIEVRMTAVKKELKIFDSLIAKLAEADNQINGLLHDIGAVSQAVLELKRRLKKVSENVKKVSAMKDAVAVNTEKMLAYKLVADAFSRYAIPVQLLRNLRTAIERRATSIYQYFTAGVIRIDDVEGARPGVEFVLYDEMGARSYKALSTGEKVMVFLAIRVAITQIINASRNNKVEFLILDEIAGNLSPTKRDALTKLINSLLRKFFSQIFMVSHVELRDIFNETIHVKKINGVSRVKVAS